MPTRPPATADLAHELRETFGRLVRRLRTESDFPMNQMAVLGLLDRQGPASISELAAAERVRPQSMAQTVRELESIGWVSRRPDPDDGRRAILELTDEGLARIHANRAAREDWLTQALERELNAAEREHLGEALALLRRLGDA
jgi:DNA-binding MarR family transcriptional regulator